MRPDDVFVIAAAAVRECSCSTVSVGFTSCKYDAK